jgi:putative peptidoglycan lipid II flippase
MGAGLAVTALVAGVGTPAFGVTAIVAANAAGITVTAVLLLAGLNKRVMPMPVAGLAVAIGRLAVAAVAAAGAGWLALRAVSGLPGVVVLAVGGVVTLMVFAAAAAALGAQEIRQPMVLLRNRGTVA